jgi:hypothetical protein
MLSFTSRTRLADSSRHSSPNYRHFILLWTLCRRKKTQLLCNQANPNSFPKTPGVGYIERISRRDGSQVTSLLVTNSLPCHTSANCTLTSFPATHTNSLSSKSFRCHTSEKMGVSPSVKFSTAVINSTAAGNFPFPQSHVIVLTFRGIMSVNKVTIRQGSESRQSAVTRDLGSRSARHAGGTHVR